MRAILEPLAHEVAHTLLAHVAERHRRAGRVLSLSKEFSLGVFVTLNLPKFNRATLSNSPDVHLQEFGALTGTGRAHHTQDENGRVTRYYIVQLDAQSAF